MLRDGCRGLLRDAEGWVLSIGFGGMQRVDCRGMWQVGHGCRGLGPERCGEVWSMEGWLWRDVGGC